MIPKIIFKYSWIYDQNLKKWLHYNKKELSIKQILNYINKIEKIWGKIDGKILRELARVTNLKWKSKYIHSYVVEYCIPFSDPLTVPIYKKYPSYFIDVLIHELIHQLFTQEGNLEKSKKAWNYINKKYKKESRKTRIHIQLHAIHKHIYLRFFNENRLNRDIRLMRRHKDYKIAWDIVEKEGYKNIINEFIKRVKL